MRKITSIVLVCLLCVTLPLSANEQTVFTEYFAKGTYELTFDGVPDSSIGLINLTNGWNGVETVEKTSSAQINVNGVAVFDQSDFNQTVETTSSRVPLKQSGNVLEVKVNGNPDSVIAIAISQSTSVDAIGLMESSGGELFVTDDSSDIQGAGVLISDGAFEGPRLISISKAETTQAPSGDVSNLGNVIEFGPDGIEFQQPVFIVLPYEDTNNDGVIDGTAISETLAYGGYYNAEADAWEKVAVVDRDLVNNTITISVDHFSQYAAQAVVPSSVSTSTVLLNDVIGHIIVDGSSDDWVGLPGSSVSGPDILTDSVCTASGSDIENSHSAMDADYAYISLDVDGQINPSLTYKIWVNYRTGSNVEFETHADVLIETSGTQTCVNDEDGSLGFVGCYSGSTSDGWKTSTGESLEIRIPRDYLVGATYFNIVGATASLGELDDPCDSQYAYADINWLAIFTEEFHNFYGRDSEDRYVFFLRDQNGAFIRDSSAIKEFEILDPTGNRVVLGTELGKLVPRSSRDAVYHGNNTWNFGASNAYGAWLGQLNEQRMIGTYAVVVTLEGPSDLDTDDFYIRRGFESKTPRSHVMPIVNNDKCKIVGYDSEEGVWKKEGTVGCLWDKPNLSTEYVVTPMLRGWDGSMQELRRITYRQNNAKNYFEINDPNLDWISRGADKVISYIFTWTKERDYLSLSNPVRIPDAYWKHCDYDGSQEEWIACMNPLYGSWSMDDGWKTTTITFHDSGEYHLSNYYHADRDPGAYIDCPDQINPSEPDYPNVHPYFDEVYYCFATNMGTGLRSGDYQTGNWTRSFTPEQKENMCIEGGFDTGLLHRQGLGEQYMMKKDYEIDPYFTNYCSTGIETGTYYWDQMIGALRITHISSDSNRQLGFSHPGIPYWEWDYPVILVSENELYIGGVGLSSHRGGGAVFTRH